MPWMAFLVLISMDAHQNGPAENAKNQCIELTNRNYNNNAQVPVGQTTEGAAFFCLLFFAVEKSGSPTGETQNIRQRNTSK